MQTSPAPGLPDPRMDAVREALARGDHQGAIAACRSVLTADPTHPEALLALADALLRAGWPREAAEMYARAVRHANDSAAAFAGFAEACLRLNDIDNARVAAEEALARDRNRAGAWFVLGAAFNALGERSNAIRILEHATTLAPAHTEALVVLGNAYADHDRNADAERCYGRALAADPDSTEALVALSSLYYRTERPADAKACAARALALDPTLMTAHQNMARLLADEGNDREAQIHRDCAYTDRNLLIFNAPHPERRVLVLTTATDGNTPDRHLLPAARYTRLYWFIEYADTAQMASLPAYDVAFNAIADADLASATAHNATLFRRQCRTRLLNDPFKIARTCRHLTPALLGDIDGVEVPPTIRVGADEAAQGLGAAARRADLDAPLLVRPIGSHGGEGVVLAENFDAPALNGAAPARDHYLTAFRDFRSPDGFYRKYRVFFVDREPLPYHLAIAPHWMVHYISSGMKGDASRLAEEMRFLEDPRAALGADAWQAVTAIGRRMDLDFCGLDFSLSPDGRVLVFEANATMLVHPEPDGGAFAHKNPYIARILDAFRALLARA